MMSVIIENITILELKIKNNVQTKRFILKTKSDLFKTRYLKKKRKLAFRGKPVRLVNLLFSYF
jgi:hypothetical protein